MLLNKADNPVFIFQLWGCVGGAVPVMYCKLCFTLENEPLDAKLERPIVLKPPRAGVVKSSLNKTVSRPASAASLSAPFREARWEQCQGDLMSRGWHGSPSGLGEVGRRGEGECQNRALPVKGSQRGSNPDSTPSFSNISSVGWQVR